MLLLCVIITAIIRVRIWGENTRESQAMIALIIEEPVYLVHIIHD